MRKSRGKDGKLKIYKLSDFELQQLRSVLESLPSALINKGDTKPIILDTCFSRSATGFRYDFVEGTLAQLFHPHLMGGIGSTLEENHERTLHYEVINYSGKVSVLEGTDIFMPDLKCRILSPKDHFVYLQYLVIQKAPSL